jgi:hypothetical protein
MGPSRVLDYLLLGFEPGLFWIWQIQHSGRRMVK